MKAKGSEGYTLYMRILLAGKRTDISLCYVLKRDAWDDRRQMLKGKHQDRGFVLNLMNKYRQRALEVYQQMIQRGMVNDVNIIRQKVTGKSNDMSLDPTLLKLFNSVIERKRVLAGQNNSLPTIQKYESCKNHLKSFIKKSYNSEDIKITYLNLQFIENFEVYLKTDGKCRHNTSMKHIQILKSVYRTASAHGYTDKDPFLNYKIRMEEVVRWYLSEREIQSLLELDLTGRKLSNVRDFFLFSCFTGLAYVDLKNLSARHIQFENGKRWIRTRRQKTNVKTNVPLLDLPIGIMKKHCPDFENTNAEVKIFKVISNQKMNAYLKDLAKLCRFSKVLTFHIARHTFATTITLNNGVPIESVASMLGHKHIATTQHYAKLLDKKVEQDMDLLNSRLRIE